MNLELLLKVSPGLDRKNTSIFFLLKNVFGPLSSTSTFEEHKGIENFLLFIAELLQSQVYIESAGV